MSENEHTESLSGDGRQFTAREWVEYRTKVASLVENVTTESTTDEEVLNMAEALLFHDLIDIAKLEQLSIEGTVIRSFNRRAIFERVVREDRNCEDASCRAGYVHEHGGDCTLSCTCHQTHADK